MIERAAKAEFLRLWYLTSPDYRFLDGEDVFADLAVRYSEPHRAYHTLEYHIDGALTMFDQVRSLASDSRAVELAIWFHDAVYDPNRNDNEEQSAYLFIDRFDPASKILSISAMPYLTRRVFGLIASTDHKSVVTDPDAQLLCDIDISTMGGAYEDFAAAGERIAFEYRHFPTDVFNAGRIAFLSGMLEKEYLYYTPFFREMFEAKARRNIQAELKRLSLISN